jgi:hypothetical protein
MPVTAKVCVVVQLATLYDGALATPTTLTVTPEPVNMVTVAASPLGLVTVCEEPEVGNPGSAGVEFAVSSCGSIVPVVTQDEEELAPAGESAYPESVRISGLLGMPELISDGLGYPAFPVLPMTD